MNPPLSPLQRPLLHPLPRFQRFFHLPNHLTALQSHQRHFLPCLLPQVKSTFS
jgi:hypothetical protein